MRKYVLTIILLLAVVSMWSATKRALLIGISDYPVYKNMDGASWGNIHGANDVLTIGNTLKLKGFSVTSLVNSNATAANIRKALRKFLSEVKAGDIVYLHFLCHGQPFACRSYQFNYEIKRRIERVTTKDRRFIRRWHYQLI